MFLFWILSLQVDKKFSNSNHFDTFFKIQRVFEDVSKMLSIWSNRLNFVFLQIWSYMVVHWNFPYSNGTPCCMIPCCCFNFANKHVLNYCAYSFHVLLFSLISYTVSKSSILWKREHSETFSLKINFAAWLCFQKTWQNLRTFWLSLQLVYFHIFLDTL